MKNKNHEIILEQFTQDNKTITYMTRFFGNGEFGWGIIPGTKAIFRIRIKDCRSPIKRFFDFGSKKKWAARTFIANQVFNENN